MREKEAGDWSVTSSVPWTSSMDLWGSCSSLLTTAEAAAPVETVGCPAEFQREQAVLSEPSRTE